MSYRQTKTRAFQLDTHVSGGESSVGCKNLPGCKDGLSVMQWITCSVSQG